MPRFAASLMFLFTEAPFLERFALARRAGFGAVECQNPYPWPAAEIRRRLDEENLEMVLVNAPAGDGEKGERGFAALPGREDDFRESLDRGLAYARALSCSRLHVLAGNAPAGREGAKNIKPGGDLGARSLDLAAVMRRHAYRHDAAGADRADMERTYVANLRYAAERAAGEGVRVLIEPLNPVDAAGYFLNRMEQARALAEAVGHPNLWLQYDVYHARMSGAAANPAAHNLLRPYRGDPLAETFRRNASRIAHIQIAGVPGRHEPIPSEIDYGGLFKVFDDSGYDGWIGCEYRPRAGTMEGLAWAARFGLGARAPQ